MFPVLQNKLYDTGVVLNDCVNLVVAGNYILNTPVGPSATHDPVNYSCLCPMVMWKHVLDQVLDYLDIDAEGDFITSNDLLKAFIPHSRSLDVPVKICGDKEWLAADRSFNLADFIPDWTIPDFLKALQKQFNLAIYLNEVTGNLRLQTRDPIVKALSPHPKDISSICAPIDDDQIAPPEATGIRLAATRDTRNQLAVDDEYILHEPNVEIVSDITQWSQQSAAYLYTAGFTYLVPQAAIKKDNGIVPALLFYVNRNTVGSSVFSFPTGDINRPDGTPFSFSAVGGMAATAWKAYLRFLYNRRKIPLVISFELKDIKNIDWEKKVSPSLGVCCLISSIKVRFTMRGIERSKCELWTTNIGTL
ncbi:MAG: hypothetical protein WDO15_11495 [Bacteroidota bacterium]